MSKKHHWQRAGGAPIHLDTHGMPTAQEETTAVEFFSEAPPLNRAMRRHQARFMRRASKNRGAKP